jgi:hypothetical protein
MAASNLILQGMKVEDVYTSITKTGVSEAEAATIIGSWIYENVGRSKRTFNFLTAFPATEDDCQPTFARSFQHTDWIDGESVVQAEETVGEDGFNVRFHHIEDDLDGVSADVARLFTCMAEMRKDLRTLLDEIRAELNRLNADVFACCDRRRVTVPQRDITLDPAYDFEYVDTMKFLDKYVQVFKTDKGIVMLPAVEQIKVNPGADPRVTRTAKLGRYYQSNPAVREKFPQELTKGQFVRVFGRDELDDGRKVADLVAILPDRGAYPSLEAMLDDVATREAAALRTSEMGTASIISAFGLDVDVKTVADAPVERFGAIPAAARTALTVAGIDTMGKLVEAGPEKVASVFQSEGVAADVNDAAEWVAGAMALIQTH